MANTAKQALKNVRGKVNAASKEASKTGAKTAANAPAEKPETNDRHASPFLGKECLVTKGKKSKGEMVKVYFTTKNGFGVPIARCETADGETIWLKQDYLEAKGDVSKADMDRLTAAQKAETDRTFYIDAEITYEGDNSVRMAYHRFVKEIWFPKSMVVRTGAHMPNGTKSPIYEVPAWKIKKHAGPDSFDALEARQVELTKIVTAYEKTLTK